MNDNKPFEIDKWDYKLIKLFKSHNTKILTENTFKQIWAERCGLDIEYVEIRDINQHLLDLAVKLNLFNSFTLIQFIFDLQKEGNYKFICDGRKYLKKDETDFDLILLSRLDSLFSLTEVKKITGWEKFVKNN